MKVRKILYVIKMRAASWFCRGAEDFGQEVPKIQNRMNAKRMSTSGRLTASTASTGRSRNPCLASNGDSTPMT
jgi:hypothetical protein